MKTLAVDCGGTGIKAAVLSSNGKSVRVIKELDYLRTPYPLSPQKLISIIGGFISQSPQVQRLTVGLPGMIRAGKVVVIPHYVNPNGPSTRTKNRASNELKNLWYGFNMQRELHRKFRIPTLVLNDAEIHAAAVVKGKGLELVLTFGTGLGSAIYLDGKLAAHLEISHFTVRAGRTVDMWIGEIARKRIGNTLWSRRVKQFIKELYPMVIWDRLYIGGHNAQRLKQIALRSFDGKVQIIPNSAGVTGGVRAWNRK